jgi:GNAT superfamily N-acetyltransferase
MPHSLYRSILLARRSARTRIALVMRDGEPSLIAGIAQQSRYVWEPICNWQAPGPVFPARSGEMIPALTQLGLEIPVAWWRSGAPPRQEGVRSVETDETYRLELSKNPEEFWRETNYLRTIRKMRNRCKTFTCEVNAPGATEWLIQKWAEKWGVYQDAATRFHIEDRIRVAKALEASGLHFTLSMHENGKMIGGASTFVHKGDLVAGVIYHEPEYRSHGAGVRLIDLAFEHAMKLDLKAFDLGGKADYKRKWAPASGTRSSIVVAPRYLYHGRRALGLARTLYQNLRTPPQAVVQA